MNELRPFSESISTGSEADSSRLGKFREIKLVMGSPDINPRNVFLKKDGTIVLGTDLGKPMTDTEFKAMLKKMKLPKIQIVQQITKRTATLKKMTPTFIRSTSTNLAKYLLTKQGLKVSAKTLGKIIGKLSGSLMSPWLAPLIWSPEIIDIARSKEVKRIWKNMQSEAWWKEAQKRDEIMRERIKKGEKVTFANVVPQGEFYHKDIGWY